MATGKYRALVEDLKSLYNVASQVRISPVQEDLDGGVQEVELS